MDDEEQLDEKDIAETTPTPPGTPGEVFSGDPNNPPSVVANFEQAVAIPYTTTQPTFTPKFNGVRRVYFDGTDYWLYIYANGAWRKQKIGGSSTVVGRSIKNANQTINNTTSTKITWDSNDYATGITWDSTNNRFTAISSGKYMVTASVLWTNTVDTSFYGIFIFVNGSEVSFVQAQAGATGATLSSHIADIVNLSGGGYVEIFVFQSSGVSNTISGNAGNCWFAIHLIN